MDEHYLINGYDIYGNQFSVMAMSASHFSILIMIEGNITRHEATSLSRTAGVLRQHGFAIDGFLSADVVCMDDYDRPVRDKVEGPAEVIDFPL